MAEASNLPIELGNSPVNHGVYYRRFYRIPMIITSNNWQALVRQQDPEDAAWLERNAIVQVCDKDTLF